MKQCELAWSCIGEALPMGQQRMSRLNLPLPLETRLRVYLKGSQCAYLCQSAVFAV